jgi:predicted ferric reductase
MGTVLAAAAVYVVLDIVNSWGFLVFGGYRAGVVALAFIGFAMCTLGSDYSTVRGVQPLVVVAGILGVAALVLMIAGLIWATAPLFVWFGAVIVALWAVTTVRHLVTPRTTGLPKPAAS